MPIKVLIIDDSALVRETLSQILNSDSDIKVPPSKDHKCGLMHPSQWIEHPFR